MSKNQQNTSEYLASTSLESAQRLEAIKNLIFGENIQQIDQDFVNLKNLIDQRKEELDSYIEQIKKELWHSVDNLSTDLNIRMTTLESSLNEKIDNIGQNKMDRASLGNLLISLGEKIMKD